MTCADVTWGRHSHPTLVRLYLSGRGGVAPLFVGGVEFCGLDLMCYLGG